MKASSVLISLLFFAQSVLCVDKAMPKNTPVSRSYSSLKQCFPDLVSSEFTEAIDLGRLKEKIDNIYLTTRSNLRYRRMTFLDANKDTKRLTVRVKSIKNQVYDYEMLLEKLDDKGVATEMEIPQKHRKNPKQSDINTYILNTDLIHDETSFIDTKLNGHILTYERNFTAVQGLVLRDSEKARTLTCENQKNLGVVCTCK